MIGGIVAVCVITCLSDLTPGPNFWKIVHHAVATSRRNSLIFALGLLSGSMVHCLMGLAGIAALMAQFDAALLVIQIAGGGYIAHYGLRLLLASRKRDGADPTAAARADPLDQGLPAGRLWLDGLLTNMANPKTILFYASLFAAVMTPSQSMTYLLLMIGCLLATSLTTNALVACLFSLPLIRRTFKQWERAVCRIIGGLLIVAGLKIALQRN